MIYIIWAPPRQGKSYVMTDEIVRLLASSSKRRIFTNWPVIIKLKDGTTKSSLVWSPELSRENIQSSEIYIDEAYMDYSSREYKKFEKDTHSFFACNGHNDVNITLIAQNPARIDLIIREMCNGFLFVKKTTIPHWLWIIYAKIVNSILKKDIDENRPRPIFFTILTYLTEKDMAMRSVAGIYAINRVWFHNAVAMAYDTHYYRNVSNKVYQGKTWQEMLNLKENPTPDLAVGTKNLENIKDIQTIIKDVRDYLPDLSTAEIPDISELFEPIPEIIVGWTPTLQERVRAWLNNFLEKKTDMPDDLWIPGPPVSISVSSWGTIS